jgi:RimJ/RimL family protein N-acetyltransferase
VYENEDKVLKGYIRFFDIENNDSSAPLFDIKVVADARGQGIGTDLVQYAVAYIFKHFQQIRRIEATTREDNLAMQKVLSACGFVHEATYRKAWKVNGSIFIDSLGYALLREEFEARKKSDNT